MGDERYVTPPDRVNAHYDDCYFSAQGAEESYYVFIEGNNLAERMSKERLVIGETGFGTGLNLLWTWFTASNHQSRTMDIQYYSVEKYPIDPAKLDYLLEPLPTSLLSIRDKWVSLWHEWSSTLHFGMNSVSILLPNGSLTVHLFYGDVLAFLSDLPEPVDVWFLDGHTPAKNPEMWCENVFSGIAAKSHVGTTLATYTSAGIVKEGLRRAGFVIKRKKGFGRKHHMVVGAFQ